MMAMNSAKSASATRPSVATSFWVLIAALVLIWLVASVGILSAAVPVVIALPLVFFLQHRRFTAALILVLATPLSASFFWGIVDYANGNARLRCLGYPGTTFYNLDPKLRCGRTTSGCIVFGN